MRALCGSPWPWIAVAAESVPQLENRNALEKRGRRTSVFSHAEAGTCRDHQSLPAAPAARRILFASTAAWGAYIECAAAALHRHVPDQVYRREFGQRDRQDPIGFTAAQTKLTAAHAPPVRGAHRHPSRSEALLTWLATSMRYRPRPNFCAQSCMAGGSSWPTSADCALHKVDLGGVLRTYRSCYRPAVLEG
jgi:hypothetical protein